MRNDDSGRRSGFGAIAIGACLGLLGLSFHLLLVQPVAAFFDPRWPGLVLAAGGVIAVGAAAVRNIRRGGGEARAPLVAALCVALILTGAAMLVLGADVLRHDEAQVTFQSGDLSLAGTLYLPAAPGPHPGVVLVHGSSPGTRGIFRPFGNFFARRGVATLAYDKRGFGGSEGSLPYTYTQLADDAAAAVAWLGRRADVDGSEVGLVGFSEGGWTAPLAASRSDSVAFLVVVSGGALTPAEQELWELRTRLEDAGFGSEAVGDAVALERALQNYYRTGRAEERILASLHRAAAEPWFEVAFDRSPDDIPGSLEDVAYVHDPTELDFDALPVLEELRIPELFVFGGADRLVPPRRSAAAIRRTLRAEPASDFRIEVFPRADHLLLEWPLDPMPWPRFAPGFLDTLSTWIERAGASDTPGAS